MCVLDTTYKFWFVYDNLRPRSIIVEDWVTYIADRNTDIVRKFDDTVFTDVTLWTSNSTTFDQSLLLKEIDLGDIFTPKCLAYIYFSLENYTQQFIIDVFYAINQTNSMLPSKVVTSDEIAIGWWTLWEGNLGENTFWSSGMLDIISVPILKKEVFANDPAHIYKIRVQWYNWQYFYLNQMDIGIGWYGQKKQTFDASNTF